MYNKAPEQTDFWINQNYSFDYPYSSPTFGGFGGIMIDEQSPQTWYNFNTHDIYYYPVLPKFNAKGEFDEERLGLLGDWNPFGSPERRWNQDDIFAPITSVKLPEQWINYSLIDMSFEAIEDDTLDDKGPISNKGMLIGEYDIDYTDVPIEIEVKKPTITTKLGKKGRRKAY